VRASDRPQSIAGWRPILGQVVAPGGDVTLVIAQPAPVAQPVAAAAPPPAAAPTGKRGIGRWIGIAAAVLFLLAGGYYALVDDKRAAPQMAAGPSPAEKAA